MLLYLVCKKLHLMSGNLYDTMVANGDYVVVVLYTTCTIHSKVVIVS